MRYLPIEHKVKQRFSVLNEAPRLEDTWRTGGIAIHTFLTVVLG